MKRTKQTLDQKIDTAIAANNTKRTKQTTNTARFPSLFVVRTNKRNQTDRIWFAIRYLETGHVVSPLFATKHEAQVEADRLNVAVAADLADQAEQADKDSTDRDEDGRDEA